MPRHICKGDTVMVTAGNDKMVSTPAAMAMAERVPGIAAVKIDHARHELLNERDEFREQFWAAFDSFVEEPAEQASPGIFAAGDICGPPWQMAKAVGEGCVAGINAANYAKKLKP